MKKGKRTTAPSLMDFSTRRSNEGDNEDFDIKFKSGSRNTADKFNTLHSNRGHFNKTQQNGFKSIDLK